MGAQLGEHSKMDGGTNGGICGNVQTADGAGGSQSGAAPQALQARRWRRSVPGGDADRCEVLALEIPLWGQGEADCLGVFPEISLARAGELRDEARAQLRGGIDPASQRKLDKLAGHLAAENSFEAIAREWLDTKSGEWMPDQSAKVRAWLENHVFPWIGDKPVAELEAPEVLSMLRRLVKRGTLNTAGRIRETVSAIFRYAIATGRATRDPAADLRDALPKADARNFAAIIEPKEVAELLRAIDGYQGHPVTLAALRLAPMLFQRPGELRAMEWSEVDFDEAEWRIPPSHRKLRKAAKENPRTPPHIVPLAQQAVTVLRDLHRLTGTGVLVFPACVAVIGQ